MGGKTKKKSKSSNNRGRQSGPATGPARSPHHDQGDEGGMGAARNDAPAAAAARTAAPVMECDICHESFDSGSRKPRNLICGHGFCTVCCKELIQQQAIICPKCRQTTKLWKSPEDLPVNYPVLNMVTNQDGDGAAATQNIGSLKKREETSPHGGKCLDADVEVSKHCAHCQMFLCQDCSRIDHSRPECLLTSARETLVEMNQGGMTKAMSTQNTLKEFSHEAMAYDGKLRSFATLLEIALDCVKREQGHLSGLLDHSQRMGQQLRDIGAQNLPANIEEALIFLDMMENATTAAQQWAANACAFLKGEQVFKLSKELMQTSVQMHNAAGTCSNGEVMGLHSIRGVNVTLPVEMDGSRLLVHATQPQAAPAGSRVVKLQHIKACIDPSCALTFLDISLRGQELGRMFIRLLGCTKRSLSFLMMCTGEAGPSFLNTRFHRMWGASLSGGSVWAGDHDRGDGSGGTLPSEILHEMKELSDKKTKVPITAGLVAGRYGKTNSTIFRVYTNQRQETYEDVAIGRVEYGLNILQDALKNTKSITDLIISGCGMVIEP